MSSGQDSRYSQESGVSAWKKMIPNSLEQNSRNPEYHMGSSGGLRYEELRSLQDGGELQNGSLRKISTHLALLLSYWIRLSTGTSGQLLREHTDARYSRI